jgi:hypothetical protein
MYHQKLFYEFKFYVTAFIGGFFFSILALYCYLSYAYMLKVVVVILLSGRLVC